MNWGALFIIGFGFVLIVIGWQGTYAKVWNFITVYTASGAQANQTPTNQPSNSVQPSNPSSTGIPQGAPGQGQFP